MVKLEVFGIALEISNASPIAFSLVLLSKTMSSIEFEAQRNARDDPTKPLPIMEISYNLISFILIKELEL